MKVNYFYALTFGMTVLCSQKNLIGSKVVFSSTKFDFWSFISSKNEIKGDHYNRSKVEKICIENAHLLISKMQIRHQFADLPNFKKMIAWYFMWSKQYVKARQNAGFYNQGQVQRGKTNITRDIAAQPSFLTQALRLQYTFRGVSRASDVARAV